MAYRRLQVFDQLHGRRAGTARRWQRPALPILLGLIVLAVTATLALLVLPVFGRPASAALTAPAAPAIERPAPDVAPGIGVATPPLAEAAAGGAAGPAGDSIPPPESPGPVIAPVENRLQDQADPVPPKLVDLNTVPDEAVAEVDLPAEAADALTPEGAPSAPAVEPAYLLELPDGQSEPVRVPILMYHHIGGLPDDPDDLRIGLTLSVDDFAAQLAFLSENGFQTVTLNDVVAAMYGEADLPERPIVLTFDDGYLDHYTNAFPLLQEYGMTGTFFIVTSLVGDYDYVTWEHLREMAAAGMRIEAHGLTHRDLRYLGSDGIRHEAIEAKRTLEAETDQPVRFYCYPAGKYTEETPEILAEAGYLGAVTVRHGLTADPAARFEIPRVRINRGDGAFRLAGALDGSE